MFYLFSGLSGARQLPSASSSTGMDSTCKLMALGTLSYFLYLGTHHNALSPLLVGNAVMQLQLFLKSDSPLFILCGDS